MAKKIKDWTTKAGLRAVVILANDGSHHCGYVEVNKHHPLFGKHYGDKCCPPLPEDEVVGKRGLISILINACNEGDKISIDMYFNVHGGISFSDKFKNESDGWWFGYDCAHLGDLTKGDYSFGDGVWRDEEYCIAECESLAKQLVDFWENDSDKVEKIKTV